MKRGEIWTVSGGADYASKPRPCVILQDDRFADTRSISICTFTSNTVEAPLLRPPIEPDTANGLRDRCRLMADKITTVPRAKLGKRIGVLSDTDILRLNRAVLVFLGLAG